MRMLPSRLDIANFVYFRKAGALAKNDSFSLLI